MATEIGPDGMSIAHNGARIYISPTNRSGEQPEMYRVQVYKDTKEGSLFHQTYEVGTLQDAQQCGINNANLMDVAPPWRPDTDDVSTPVNSDGHFYTGHSEMDGGQEWFEVVDEKGNPYQTLERPKPEIIELICPHCEQSAKFTDAEITEACGVIFCEHHDVLMITMDNHEAREAWYENLRILNAADFEAKVDAMEVHPDDFLDFN